MTSAWDIFFGVHDFSLASRFLTSVVCALIKSANSDVLRATFGVWLTPLVVSPLLPGTSISMSLPWHLPQQCLLGSTLRL